MPDYTVFGIYLIISQVKLIVMTIHEYHFEQVHTQMPIDTGLNIADIDLIGASFGYKTDVDMCTYPVYSV
jgi:hypothetical protein